MIFLRCEDGIVFARCEYCGRELRFPEMSLKRILGKDWDQLAFPRTLECFCGAGYEAVGKVPKLPYNAEIEEEDIIFEEPWKDYFGKMQCYMPLEIEPDCPVRILEAAILKDTREDEILLRLRMKNVGEKDLVAVFVEILMEDISGSVVGAKESQSSFHYIYEDILIHRGEFFGEKTSVRLPDKVRRVSVRIEKAAFLDGRLWRGCPEQVITIKEQEEIKLPADFNERFISILKKDFEEKKQELSLIQYYYEENPVCWQCTCGKINFLKEESCGYCGLGRSYVKDTFSESAISEKLKEYQNEIHALVEEHERFALREEKGHFMRRIAVPAGGLLAVLAAAGILMFFL